MPAQRGVCAGLRARKHPRQNIVSQPDLIGRGSPLELA